MVRRSKTLHLSGYLTKSADEQEFIKCLDALSGGKSYYDKKVRQMLANDDGGVDTGANSGKEELLVHKLTKREIEVMKEAADGYNTKQIADRLSISIRTVETHRKVLWKNWTFKILPEWCGLR
jgi:DNA-binding NarL/FixJ family response regulator